MGLDSIYNMLDLLVLGCGFYAMYSAWILQREGKIVRTFLVFKETDVDSCKDLQGFANCMSPKLWTLGGVMAAYGGVPLLNTYVVSIETLFWVMMAVFFAVLFWYGYEVKKAMKKYF